MAIDLLVKPFDVDRFETALDLAKSKIVRARTELQAADRSSQEEPRGSSRQFLQRLAVEAGEKIVLVRVEDIQWMQSSGKHIRLHVGKTSHLLLRVDEVSVQHHLELSARTLDERGVQSARLLDLRRQTGGAGKIVSLQAVGDLERHGVLHGGDDRGHYSRARGSCSTAALDAGRRRRV